MKNSFIRVPTTSLFWSAVPWIDIVLGIANLRRENGDQIGKMYRVFAGKVYYFV
jgi:hypothetical protein